MITVTLLRGDGIGPEIVDSLIRIFDYLKLDINFEEQLLGKRAVANFGDPLPQTTIASIKNNKVVLKAPYETEIAQGFRSVNVALRQAFDLYANVRPIKTLIPEKSKYGILDFTIIRENTEDLYIGKEEIIEADQEVQAIKRITRPASERIVRYAFDYAISHNKNKVTCVHKANILKLTDGLFLQVFKEVAAQYPTITANDLIVDNAAMQLVLNPAQFEVMVMPNLYGDILSDLASGLIGGLGLAPSANIGRDYGLFEASHGCAPDIAGKNLANPTAFLLSGCMLLDYLDRADAAKQIRTALNATLKNQDYTCDLGGSLTTTAFTDKIIANFSLLPLGPMQ